MTGGSKAADATSCNGGSTRKVYAFCVLFVQRWSDIPRYIYIYMHSYLHAKPCIRCFSHMTDILGIIQLLKLK